VDIPLEEVVRLDSSFGLKTWPKRKGPCVNYKEEMDSLHSSIQKKETDLKRVVHDLKNPLLSMGA
jgi:hypothetical protein